MKYIIQIYSFWIKVYVKMKNIESTFKMNGLFLGSIRARGMNNSITLNGIITKTKINIIGNNNRILIKNGRISNLDIRIKGDHHQLVIENHRGIVNSEIVILDIKNLISIGESTGIGGARMVVAGNNNYIKIGRENMISDYVEIWATDSHSIIDNKTKQRINPDKPVVLGDNVWIGSGVKILKGVNVNHNSIIGMGSVVSKDVTENSISAGNPNKIIKRNIDWCIERL